MVDEIFSIIMPAYNAETTIAASINSVLMQSESNFKLYVVNDYSTDSTKEIVLSFTDSRIVYLENDVNLGVAKTRNKAIEACGGIYICFLDSDDLWHPQKLEKQLSILNKGWDVVANNYSTFRYDIANIVNKRTSPEVISFDDMLKSNYIGNLTGIYNAKKLGKFYQKTIGHEDYVMWLEIFAKTKQAYCIQENLAYYRLSKNSLSANKLVVMLWQWNIYRRILHLPLIKSIYYFICYIYLGLSKRV
ncbi:glycosyltransferase family 2 protein [Citrobacter freundii]|uniref:glycosyltransferase n=1 Tax=Citrobacter freundii TaxID=546 RepID=UPI0015FB0BB7|nr:glycosyltransferase family 2 protein [Citrobacter freundii]